MDRCKMGACHNLPNRFRHHLPHNQHLLPHLPQHQQRHSHKSCKQHTLNLHSQCPKWRNPRRNRHLMAERPILRLETQFRQIRLRRSPHHRQHLP
jgi:hypothetical protein